MKAELEELTSKILLVTPGDKVSKAMDMAIEVHEFDVRDEGSPYIFHPLAVATICQQEFGRVDEETIILALLHDVPEKVGGIPSAERLEKISKIFGSSISSHIDTLSRKVGKTREERDSYYTKQIAEAPLSVRLVKLADRLHNVRSLRTNPDKSKVFRYIQETRAQILPMAKDTMPLAAKKIEDELKSIESSLAGT